MNGTIVECNTAYGGRRSDTESHLKAARDPGFTSIASVDILDTDGEVELPLKGGRHLKKDIVGSHYPDYDFMVVLSHFKGHAMGGFGEAIKNISIDSIASMDTDNSLILNLHAPEEVERLYHIQVPDR